MTSENKGYSLTLLNRENNEKKEKVYLKPMAFYVPDFAAGAVVELLNQLPSASENKKGFLLTVTNNNNGVSVDKDLATFEELKDKTISAEAVKELVNIVRGYDADEDTNVCGW
ncbi:DUF1869 domain-containing protein [Pectobacterium brasiliense]|uniref:DUF1869 domain-containing protein n=1 Tax=Pectobacterium brasiliense TaxID=180957 RepID=UPI00069A698C|nr:DUF1869 domain-containing protein [Pectobacterium brasiliense]MBN3191822.1 DUF1869 domain-containing protein [Pectobacterium brasiliense]MCA5918379.1 DUF1869 domain-containing protein [Pectobacterium brasiliense]MCA5926082.1 DUF1869 domain-containing protein [Pectobacterium brasiliense]MCA5934243.1 DUF1869 domain-containing protein [Pectobacterium brasiliense]MCA5938425.1 DUF1869 domain-containing protein [Pectobacterium brasiliense]